MQLFKDTYRHQGMRNKLAERLKKKGIVDDRVLQAIRSIPRHLLIDSAFEEHAYQDKAFPIGAGQTISNPYTVAFQTELLQVKPGQKVLEIGTGSGYQSVVLLYLGVILYTIERQKELFDFANEMIRKIINRRVYTYFGDGYKGLPTQAPFDRILVTAGASQLPTELLSQLTVGGKLVIPLGEEKQIMTLYERVSKTEFLKSEHGDFMFVPMLKNKTYDEK